MLRQNKLNKLLGITREYCSLRQLRVEEEEQQDEEVEVPFEFELKPREDRLDKKTINDLTIKPLVAEEDDYLRLHPQLPKIPFSMYVVGCRGAGKSVLTQALGNFCNGLFDMTILWSPTAELDQKWRMFFEAMNIEWKPNKNVIYEYSEDKLKKIMAEIKKHNKGKSFKDKVRVLMIFDDMISQLPKGKQNTKFNNLILNNRHFNCSVVVISQAWKLVDSRFRANCSQVALWDSENVKEKEKILEELGGSKYLGNSLQECKRNFQKIWEEATSKTNHSCLYINFHAKDIDCRYNIDFDTPIPISHLKQNGYDCIDEGIKELPEPEEELKEEGTEETEQIENEEHIEEVASQSDCEVLDINEEDQPEEGNLDKMVKELMKMKKGNLVSIAQLNNIDTKKKTKKKIILELLELEDLKM